MGSLTSGRPWMKLSLESPRYRKTAPWETELGLWKKLPVKAQEGKAECPLAGKRGRADRVLQMEPTQGSGRRDIRTKPHRAALRPSLQGLLNTQVRSSEEGLGWGVMKTEERSGCDKEAVWWGGGSEYRAVRRYRDKEGWVRRDDKGKRWEEVMRKGKDEEAWWKWGRTEMRRDT